MKKVLTIIGGIIETIIILFAISMIVLLMSTNKYGYTQIGSKTLVSIDKVNITELDIHNEGELIILDESLYSNNKVGDTLYYYDTYDNKYIIKYGTIKALEGDNRSALYTFEENSDVRISSDRVIGKLKRITKLGKFYEIITSTIGFLLLVILPILVVFIYQVYKFVLLLKEN